MKQPCFEMMIAKIHAGEEFPRIFACAKEGGPMSIEALIQKTPSPITQKSLYQNLQSLGIQKGDTIEVHSSLSQIGWICGEATALIFALIEAVGPEGNIVMAAQSSDIGEPSNWERPPVPKEWWPIIRAETPPYDPLLNHVKRLGAVAECFRSWPGVLRSSHPLFSFTAYGKDAEEITKDHALEYSFGEGSPLKKLYDMNAKILLIGVQYDRCTALHLAEARSGLMPEIEQGAPMMENGKRLWKTFRDYDWNSDRFAEIQKDYEKEHPAAFTLGKIGLAESRLIAMRPLIDYGTKWIREDGAKQK